LAKLGAWTGIRESRLSLQKQWQLRESMVLQFRVDAYNTLNHPNFNLPGRIFGASNLV
jgi:hypothetical protein